MPSDIRSFFGGKPANPTPKAPKKEEEPSKTTKASKKGRRIIDESDEEEEPAPKTTPKRSTPKRAAAKRAVTPDGEATTTSDYFGKEKPKRSQPARNSKPAHPGVEREIEINGSAKKGSPAKAQTNGHTTPSKKASSAKGTPAKGRSKKDDEDEDNHDNVFKQGLRNKKGDDDYEEDDDEDDAFEIVVPKRAALSKGKQRKAKVDDDDFELDDVDMKDVDFQDNPKPAARSTKSTPAKKTDSKKRKSEEAEIESEEDASPKKRGRKPAAAKQSPEKKRQKKEDPVPENKEMQAIYDSIPTVRPPTPPPPSGENRKWNPQAHAANTGPAPSAGSKEIPDGAENCLAGLTFVFTGLLETISREQGQELVKRYGGKVTTAPSTKTSFVVLGSDAGPKKLETIRKNNIKTIDEDGLFELIRRLPANGGDSKAAAKHEEKKQKEAEKVKEMAAEMEKEERRAQAATKATASPAGKAKGKQAAAPVKDSRLWTVKYAPTQMTQICGNKTQVDKLSRWLKNYPKNQRTGFKLAGPDGSGTYRAVMIHGPPGIGKTTAAHLVAKLEGYDVVESNASDTRSKKLVEEGLRGVLSTTSLLGYFAGDGKDVAESKKKLVLIMDEVDGMSAGDRGGVGALAAVCKKTQIPMILICNDRRLPKMKPFDYVTYDLPFRRPTTDQIRSRIMTIAYREGIKLPAQVIDALIEGSGADIRQVVNMVSTAKLDEDGMDFDKSKKMSKAWEKHIILKPWDITSKILGGAMWAASSKATLNDKVELYFNDHEFSYLMLQENYLNTFPAPATAYSGRQQKLKVLEMVDKAAESISDGDLIDRMIHGPQQHWSLMPTHAISSFVRPASFVAGNMSGNRMGFTSWLGKNSMQQRMGRQVKEIQAHMRLKSSGDRHEVRQQYIPSLWRKMIKDLEENGKEQVPEVIDFMDSYFLTKDDWDAILELGVGYMDQEKVKLESSTKATFTRLYNIQSHPLPYIKASNVQAPRAVAKAQPDLEEAIEESDEGEVVEEVKKEEDEEVDLSKDKYVKQPKKKKAAASGAGASSAKGKRKKTAAADEGDGDEDEEDVKPKKSRGKGKAKK